jgi:hypothetical protein
VRFHIIDICILKAIFFCILFYLWTHFNTLEHEIWLGGMWPTRPRHAPNKTSELHLNVGLNFIDLFILKALFVCILFSLWTHFNTLEYEVWLGGGWPPRWPRRLPKKTGSNVHVFKAEFKK